MNTSVKLLVMMLLLTALLSTCGGGGGGGGRDIASWAFVDGNGANGINKDATKNAYLPQLTVLGSKLYAIWLENNDINLVSPMVSQIRVAVYNGDDASPSWAFVDGNGGSGINKDATKYTGYPPQLTVLGSKLYATWTERNSMAYQIRVAVYNGDDASPSWAFVDGNGANGINKDATKSAESPQLTVLGSKLYATWAEDSGSGMMRIWVAVYNGDDASPSWAFVVGNYGANGIISADFNTAFGPQLTVLGSKLYATWLEFNNIVGPSRLVRQIRVAVYNGDDASPSWAFVDVNGANGINKDATKSAESPQLTVLGSKLYATWVEDNGATYQIRVAEYNGDDASPSWAFVDGNGANGINKDATKNAGSSQLTVLGSKLFATWAEDNGAASQIRVAEYNGNDTSPSWAFVDGNGANGINKDATKNADSPQLTVLGSKLYTTWAEDNGVAFQISVAVGQ
jgi:hypothetical protein